MSTGTVQILCDHEIPPVGHQIAEQIRNDGHQVVWTTLDQAPISTGTILCLLDLTDPFLSNMSSKEYESLQQYIIRAAGARILWVTQCAQMKCSNPYFGLILGLARTMRYEMSIDFATVEMDNWDAASLGCLLEVFRKFHAKRIGGTDDSQEYEFAVHDWTVYVGRFDWKPLPAPTIGQICPEFTKSLDIKNYGVLDTMSWAAKILAPLGDDEVEVEIHYAGLNFRVSSTKSLQVSIIKQT